MSMSSPSDNAEYIFYGVKPSFLAAETSADKAKRLAGDKCDLHGCRMQQGICRECVAEKE